MKVKSIKIEYTTGKVEELKNPSGFIISDKLHPLQDWDMNMAYEAMATLMLSTMSAQVDNYGTYRPLFDKLEETLQSVEKQLSPSTWAKEFAARYQQAFLWDEVIQDEKLIDSKRKYKELHDKMIRYSRKAAEKLNAKTK